MSAPINARAHEELEELLAAIEEQLVPLLPLSGVDADAAVLALEEEADLCFLELYAWKVDAKDAHAFATIEARVRALAADVVALARASGVRVTVFNELTEAD